VWRRDLPDPTPPESAVGGLCLPAPRPPSMRPGGPTEARHAWIAVSPPSQSGLSAMCGRHAHCEKRLIRGSRRLLRVPIGGALPISKGFDSVHGPTNISRHAVASHSRGVVQIDSFSFLNDCEKPTLIVGPHVAFLSVPYSILFGFVRPMRELSRMGSALDRPHFRSGMGSDRLRPHF